MSDPALAEAKLGFPTSWDKDEEGLSTVGGSDKCTCSRAMLVATLVILAVVIVVLVWRARKSSAEGFASEGGPAGRALLGGSVVQRDMDAVALEKNPCGPAGCSTGLGAAIGCSAGPMAALRTREGMQVRAEGFEPTSWDERANFTPNPHPENPSLLGHDLMGVPRRFDIE